MNEPLRLTAIFVRDLLSYDESLIKIGRDGDTITDFTIGYIAIDSLGASQRLASGKSYDGDTEVMTYQQQWRMPVTVTFYGDDAWSRATKYALRIQSQQALELQEVLGIGVFQASNITDVKILTGQQYGERLELALNIHYSTHVDIDTRRIDTEQINLIADPEQEIIYG
jgi:hypothetical protein